MRRLIQSISVGTAIFASIGAASAEPAVDRAGPITVPISECLIVKLNPGMKEACAPPVVENIADPTARAASHMRAAAFYISVREFPQARLALDAGLAAKPDDFELLLLSARLAITFDEPATRDEQRAAQDIGRALKLKPQDSDARATYVTMMRTKVTPSHLVREYGAILANDPKHDYSRSARVELLQELGRHREALADLDVLVARDAADATVFNSRAGSYMAMNEPKAAVEDFTSALRLQSNDVIALTGRAAAFELLGDDDKALADYDAILGPVGGQPRYAIGGDTLGRYWFQRAFLLVRLKRFKDAATDMAAALATEKSSILRAQIFLRQNGFQELPLDGRDSPPLRSALQACFGLQSCFDRIQRGI